MDKISQAFTESNEKWKLKYEKAKDELVQVRYDLNNEIDVLKNELYKSPRSEDAADKATDAKGDVDSEKEPHHG